MARLIAFLVLLAASPIAAADLICDEDISSIEEPWIQAVCQAQLDQDVIRNNNLRLFVHLHHASRSNEGCPSPGEYLPALRGFQNRVRAAEEALCDLNMLLGSGSGMVGAGYGSARTARSAYTVGHLLDRLEDTTGGPTRAKCRSSIAPCISTTSPTCRPSPPAFVQPVSVTRAAAAKPEASLTSFAGMIFFSCPNCQNLARFCGA